MNAKNAYGAYGGDSFYTMEIEKKGNDEFYTFLRIGDPDGIRQLQDRLNSLEEKHPCYGTDKIPSGP